MVQVRIIRNLRSENNLLALGIASKLVVVLHLQLSGNDPLPWSTRVQIALDAARGLEYIHEHTVPVYVHRDIKSANILIDKNLRAKVVKMPVLVWY